MANQHLSTIPIWDAIKGNTECPLCYIKEHSEAQYVDNFLGGSVMEPAVRIEVNEKGFCQRHFEMLFEAKNRLSLALMEHTYLLACIKKLESSAPGKKKLLAREAEKHPHEGLTESCILCDRLNDTMWRYALTVVHMWKSEPPFVQALLSGKGFCLPHFFEMLRAAQHELHGVALAQFQQQITDLELDNLRRTAKDIEWFTLKFDYRNQDKPWGTSEDAVERTINKLRGITL